LLSQLRKLVNRCLQGDQSAMAELVAQYERRVFALCYRMLGHRQDAEDVTQQTLIRVLKNLGSWDQRRQFEPWLFAIAGNRCRTALSTRAKKGKVQSISEPVPDQTPDPSPANQLSEEIELAIQNLRPEYQEAFRFFHYDELAYEEIADRMQRPVGTIKTWIHRTRLELVQQLRDRGVLENCREEEMTHAMR
jgi:RNA polymerase sigma-70 factor, ECF subfamily